MDTTQVGLPQVAPGVVGLYGVPQFAPQGFFGSILGGPVGGFLGSNIGNLLGNPTLGRQIGQTAGTIGGGFLPFTADPTAAAYAQQAQGPIRSARIFRQPARTSWAATRWRDRWAIRESGTRLADRW